MKKRRIFKELIEQKNTHKISVLLGPRQVGKTTLLKMLYNQLCKNNPCLFLDLDIYSNYEKVASLENFLATLKLNSYREDQQQIFLVFFYDRKIGLDIYNPLK